jgi:hypothetical protein
MGRNGICVHESVGGSNEVALDECGKCPLTYHRLMRYIFNLWNFRPHYGKDTHDFYLLDLFVVHDNLHVDFCESSNVTMYYL